MFSGGMKKGNSLKWFNSDLTETEDVLTPYLEGKTINKSFHGTHLYEGRGIGNLENRLKGNRGKFLLRKRGIRKGVPLEIGSSHAKQDILLQF